MRHLLLGFFMLLAGIPINAQEAQELSLQNAINRALENNYGIITTRKNLEKSEVNNSWGNAGALPSIRFVGSGNHTENFTDQADYSSQNLNGTVELNQTLFRGFGIYIQKDRLEELERLSEGNVAVVVENTIYNVILSYYNILLAREQMDIAQTTMQLSKDRYKREQYRKQMGNSGSYDLLQAKNAFLQDSSDYLSARSSYNNSVRQINYLMAESLENKYDFVSEFTPDTSEFVFDTLAHKMLDNNKSLQNQYINLELARLGVKSAKSAYYPTLSLNASGGYSDRESDFQNPGQTGQTGSQTSASVGLSISYAIFDGNSRKRALEAARIEKEISEVETEQMKQDLKNQLAQEYELYHVRKQLLNVARENLQSAELNLQLSEERYQNGTISSFNFRDVQQMYQNAAYNYQRAIFNVIRSYHTLLRLTGGIIEEY